MTAVRAVRKTHVDNEAPPTAPRQTGTRLTEDDLAKIRAKIPQILGNQLSIKAAAEACEISYSTFYSRYKEMARNEAQAVQVPESHLLHSGEPAPLSAPLTESVPLLIMPPLPPLPPSFFPLPDLPQPHFSLSVQLPAEIGMLPPIGLDELEKTPVVKPLMAVSVMSPLLFRELALPVASPVEELLLPLMHGNSTPLLPLDQDLSDFPAVTAHPLPETTLCPICYPEPTEADKAFADSLLKDPDEVIINCS